MSKNSAKKILEAISTKVLAMSYENYEEFQPDFKCIIFRTFSTNLSILQPFLRNLSWNKFNKQIHLFFSAHRPTTTESNYSPTFISLFLNIYIILFTTQIPSILGNFYP